MDPSIGLLVNVVLIIFFFMSFDMFKRGNGAVFMRLLRGNKTLNPEKAKKVEGPLKIISLVYAIIFGLFLLFFDFYLLGAFPAKTN